MMIFNSLGMTTMNMTRCFSIVVFACASIGCGLARGDISLYDGTTGAPNFNFGDLVLFTGASSFTIDTPVDVDSANGLFGGAGIDVSPIETFENAGAVVRIEFLPLATNVANNFRIILSDDDGGGVRDDFQYFGDIPSATPVPDGSGFLSLSIPISDGDRIFQQGSFGFAASTDFVEDYGLAQWQIQSAFGETDRLSLEVRSLEIVTAIPEPNCAVFGMLAAGAAFLRRSRSS